VAVYNYRRNLLFSARFPCGQAGLMLDSVQKERLRPQAGFLKKVTSPVEGLASDSAMPGTGEWSMSVGVL